MYKNIKRPLIIRNKVLKNRMCAANSLPHFLQGPEPYPADSVIAHYENKAKGAAITTVMGINNFTNGVQLPMNTDFGHFPDYNLYDANCQNYLMHLADSIHYYQSLASMAIFVGPPSAYPLVKFKNKTPEFGPNDDLFKKMSMFRDIAFEIEKIPGHEKVEYYDEKTLKKICDSYAEQAGILKNLDYDMVSIHMCYCGNLPAQFFSPRFNHRKDEYGGSLENRMKFPLMVLKRVREIVGNKFLIEIQWSARDLEGGYSIDDSVAFLKEASKYIDIVQIRGPKVDPAHPTGFCLDETPFLKDAAYIKKNVPDLVVGAIAGFQDLNTCEKALQDVDLIYAARAFISNSNYGELINEERNNDIVPCLRCNKCHGRSDADPFISVCSVNPVIGLEHKIDRMISTPKEAKRVALIGGGPANMRCAIYLKQRGHIPVIFEKTDTLGGLIKHSDVVDFKWPLKRYKDYLIYQIENKNIQVVYNHEVTKEELKDFDVTICGLGSRPFIPPIAGLVDYTTAVDAFMKPFLPHKKLVIIGGGEVGVECGMFLAKQGHDVTVIEMKDKLASESTKIHYYSMFKEAWESIPNFKAITNATVSKVDGNTVYYVKDSKVETIECDHIVISAGMVPLQKEALEYYGITKEFYMIGDCNGVGTIQTLNRQAFAIAHQI